MAHVHPPDGAGKFAVLVMRPVQRDRFGVNRPGIGATLNALSEFGVASAVLDCSVENAPAQLLEWLATGRVSFVYAQGGWGSEIWSKSESGEQSVFDLYGVPFLARIAVPPFSASVIHPMTAAIANRTVLLSDGDALSLARDLIPNGGDVVHFPSAFAGFANAKEPVTHNTGRRRFPGLVVMRIDPLDGVRRRWQELFPDHAAFLERLVEQALGEPHRPFAEMLSRTLDETGFDIWSLGKDAHVMLTLVNMFLTSSYKAAVLKQTARYPFRFVIDGKVAGVSFHRKAEISEPVPAADLGALHVECAAAISCNPNNMSGAISERIPIALRSGAAIVHAENSLLRRYFESGRTFLEFGHGVDSMRDTFDRLATGPDLSEMAGDMRQDFEARFGPNAMVRRLLDLARDRPV